MVALNLMALRL